MAKDQAASEERRDVKPLGAKEIAKAETDLQEATQPAAVAPADLPRSLQPIGAAEASDLFFAKAEDLQSQRAVIDTTSYGAPVVHRY